MHELLFLLCRNKTPRNLCFTKEENLFFPYLTFNVLRKLVKGILDTAFYH